MRASQRRTKTYSDNENLTFNIDGLIIDIIFEICHPIAAIAHSDTFKDPKFQNLLDFPEGYYAFFEFPETQEGGCGSLEPPKNIPPLSYIPSPRLNFNFRGNMEANQPWIAVVSIANPGAQHPLPRHPTMLLPKFDPDNDVLH